MTYTPFITIPPDLRSIVAAGGPTEARWLAQLPATVARLAAKWRLRMNDTLAGGSASLVISATQADATSAVLKLGRPGAGSLGDQAAALRSADGRGYARLLAYDVESNAILTEQLGPSLASAGLDADTQIDILGDVLPDAWRLGPNPGGFTTGAEKAARLAGFIADARSSPSPSVAVATLDRAHSFALQCKATYDPDQAVLAHGDAHAENLLRDDDAPRGYRFIDPDGLFIERAYDLGVVLRGFNAELLTGDAVAIGRSRCARLAQRTGVDARGNLALGLRRARLHRIVSRADRAPCPRRRNTGGRGSMGGWVIVRLQSQPAVHSKASLRESRRARS